MRYAQQAAIARATNVAEPSAAINSQTSASDQMQTPALSGFELLPTLPPEKQSDPAD
jgi:hypothetical protein